VDVVIVDFDAKFVQATYRPRSKYQHKGSFGHALLMAGKKGSVGAATLATRAALRSGAGLVTIHAPGCALDILQVAAPEAMVSVDKAMDHISEIPDLRRFKTIGIGCGIGTAQHLYYLMALLLRQLSRRVQEDKRVIPLVLDADALNLIAQDENGQLKKLIPPHSILTPHPKEFERLFGKTTDDFARNQLQREQAKALKSYIILKGAHSCIATPEGDCYFNSTGNPGMGTGGSGDVLTGLLTGLLAQGYTAFETCILGVYLHGLAGDLAAREIGQEALIAGDIIQHFGKAFQLLSEQ
ncbi:MAG: NAD(P)H-hydrate dehydratase, partial [Bacteroidota bacterium]